MGNLTVKREIYRSWLKFGCKPHIVAPALILRRIMGKAGIGEFSGSQTAETVSEAEETIRKG
jgi:hypothetical protein